MSVQRQVTSTLAIQNTMSKYSSSHKVKISSEQIFSDSRQEQQEPWDYHKQIRVSDSRQEQQEPWDYHTYTYHKQIRVSDITQFNLIKYMISRDLTEIQLGLELQLRLGFQISINLISNKISRDRIPTRIRVSDVTN